MTKSSPQKIAIIGCAGSGKTTLALQLKDKLKLPLYHLDQYYWKPGWQRGDSEVFEKVHTDLCHQDAWIIEGSYYKFLAERATCADLIIFLDVPRGICIWRVLKRSITNFGKSIPGAPQGCKEQLFTLKFLEFLQWIWGFKHRSRPIILQTLQQFTEKEIVVVKSPQEALTLLDGHRNPL